MFGKFFREGIRGMGTEFGRLGHGNRRPFGRSSSGQLFDHCERLRMELCAIAGELELIRGVTQQRVSKQVCQLQIHAGDSKGATPYFALASRMSAFSEISVFRFPIP